MTESERFREVASMMEEANGVDEDKVLKEHIVGILDDIETDVESGYYESKIDIKSAQVILAELYRRVVFDKNNFYN